jgi:hypothetical protein
MGYVEFKVGVPIFDLSDDDRQDCTEIRAICGLVDIRRPKKSLDELYESFYDPITRRNRGGDLFVFVADSDARTFSQWTCSRPEGSNEHGAAGCALP